MLTNLFKFQYGATNIQNEPINYTANAKFKFQYGATNMRLHK